MWFDCGIFGRYKCGKMVNHIHTLFGSTLQIPLFQYPQMLIRSFFSHRTRFNAKDCENAIISFSFKKIYIYFPNSSSIKPELWIDTFGLLRLNIKYSRKSVVFFFILFVLLVRAFVTLVWHLFDGMGWDENPLQDNHCKWILNAEYNVGLCCTLNADEHKTTTRKLIELVLSSRPWEK